MLETRANELERLLLGMAEVDRGMAPRAADTAATSAATRDADTRERTEALIRRGRRSARRGKRLRSRKRHGTFGGRPPARQPGTGRRAFARAHWRGLLMAGGVFAAAVAVAAGVLSASGPGWPPSVASVRSAAEEACQNPDVPSEPGQVNVACAPETRAMLWVFALVTSGNNPAYVDQATGRRGLEPIAPAQGGNIAWSVNLHHPYNPLDATDSITVAARAINNIIGGATLTSASGAPAVQPGLESSAANCQRYTGSAALRAKAGYPAVCAHPIRTVTGQQALVSDVFRQWMASAPAATATNVGVLFAHADDPGDPQVQAILRKLPGFGL